MAYRDGVIIRGRRRSWEWVKDHAVCRKCRAAVGRPYIDHITGEIDHERLTCSGEARHLVTDEGDLMPRGQHESLQDDAAWKQQHVKFNYGLTTTKVTSALYGDDDFEGFG